MNAAKIKASHVTKNISMQIVVTGVKVMRLRFWLGGQIIKLAALVLGCDVKLKTEHNQ